LKKTAAFASSYGAPRRSELGTQQRQDDVKERESSVGRSLTGRAGAALYLDLLYGSSLRTLAASGYGIAMLGTLFAFRGSGKGIAICLAAFGLVLAWWLTLKPSNDRAWPRPPGRK
jgi:hypothetical protein